jgi:hypothetical protein
MYVADTETVTRRRAHVTDGPTATPLTTASTSDQVAVIHVEIPRAVACPSTTAAPHRSS